MRTSFPRRSQRLRTSGDASRSAGNIEIAACGDGLIWRIGGVGSFWIREQAPEVLYRLVPGHDPSDAEQALVGPVLGTALQLAGVLLLHASGLVAGESAFGISAPSGSGKSTLATALVRRDATLLSDDALPVERHGDGYVALPYLPRLKLWGDSLDAFGYAAHSLDRIASWADKRRVTLDRGAADLGATPLRTLYLLEPHPAGIATASPVAEDLSGIDAVLALQGAVYQPDLMTPARSAVTLAEVAALARQVRVRRFRYPRVFGAVDRVAAALLADVDAVSGGRT